jgi:hypothetical protein
MVRSDGCSICIIVLLIQFSHTCTKQLCISTQD